MCIQKNLDEIRDTWNTHRLQSNDNGVGGGKRPVLLYNLPHLYHAHDHLCPVDEYEINICEEETTSKILCADENISELCKILMEEGQMNYPTTATEAKELYIQLREIILCELEDFA